MIGLLLVLKFLVIIVVTSFGKVFASLKTGAGYVGTGYDAILGNPEGQSFTDGGMDPGLKTANFVLEKTFAQHERTYCPDQAICTTLEFISESEEHSILRDATDYQDSLRKAWSLQPFSNVTTLTNTYGATMSDSMIQAVKKFQGSQVIVLEKRNISVFGEVVYDFRVNRRLSDSFMFALCELPEVYVPLPYALFIQEWGTHVILAAKIGERVSNRTEISLQRIVTNLTSNPEVNLRNLAQSNFTIFTSNISQGEGEQIAANLLTESTVLKNYISRTGSRITPAPIHLTLKGLDEFVTWKNIEPSNATICSSRLRNPRSIDTLRNHIREALLAYPDFLGSPGPPKPTVVAIDVTWPKGPYALLMPRSGCPLGPWLSAGRIHHGILDDTRTPFSNFAGQHFQKLNAGSFSTSAATLHFCSKISEFNQNAQVWPPGQYCIFKKKNQCPPGLSGDGTLQVSSPAIKTKTPMRMLNCSVNGTVTSVPYVDVLSLNTDKVEFLDSTNIKNATFNSTKRAEMSTDRGNVADTMSLSSNCTIVFTEKTVTSLVNPYDSWGDIEGVPDGDYADYTTKYRFCCQSSGDIRRPLLLPTEKPFFLFPKLPQCQPVYGMYAVLLYFGIANNDTGVNVNGDHPYATRSGGRNILSVCYYSRNAINKV